MVKIVPTCRFIVRNEKQTDPDEEDELEKEMVVIVAQEKKETVSRAALT